MSDLSIIPLEDGFETQLAQDWNGAVGTVYVLDTPSYTPTTANTYIVVNPGKTNMQIAEITDYDSTANTLTVSNVTLLKGLGINSTAPASSHATGSKVIISDNYQFWVDIQTAINSKLDKNGGNVQTYASTAARDSALGANGVATLPYSDIYVSGTGLFYNYNLSTAQWESVDTGTLPGNATTSASGLVRTDVAPAGIPVALIQDNPKYDALAGTGGTPSASNLYENQYDTSNGSTKTATTISFTSGTKTIADSGNGFVTAGFKQGTQITITGSASNNSTFTIVSVAAGAIVVAESLVTEAAGASVVMTSVKADKLARFDSSGLLPQGNTSERGALELATSAEYNTGTSTSLVPSVSDAEKYGVQSLTRADWHNTTFKAPTPSLAGGNSITGLGFSYFNVNNGSTGANSDALGTLKGTGSSNSFTYAQTKKVRIKYNARHANIGTNFWGFGLAVTTNAMYSDTTDVTSGTVRFLNRQGVLYAHTANGTTATATNVDSGITDANWNEYMIELTMGTDIKFYINGTLVATHTSTIPTTGTPNLAVGVSNGASSNIYMGLSDIIISYEL